jgi:transcriptional regulator of NAD metabolism
VENVDTYFVIVEHPIYALAMALHIADKFDKRTWQNDVMRHTHQNGAVIKLTKTDMLVITPPRVN